MLLYRPSLGECSAVSSIAHLHEGESSLTSKHLWHDTGVWLMGDTHVHHRQTGLERTVDEASRHGCDYLAFTEHAHYTEYFKAQPELMEKAHAARPNMILVNGVEWSTPAGDETRAEQAGLLMPGGVDGMPAGALSLPGQRHGDRKRHHR